MKKSIQEPTFSIEVGGGERFCFIYMMNSRRFKILTYFVFLSAAKQSTKIHFMPQNMKSKTPN